jgi:hypothetical protein
MARLSDRIENVLNEDRILLLGGQVLLGFSYRICFEPRFEGLPRAGQSAELIALAIMTAGLSWLVWPAAYHRIAERGWQNERILALTNTVLDWGLLPVGAGLGLSFYPVCLALHIPHPAVISIASGSIALAAWYGAGELREHGARKRARPVLAKQERRHGGGLEERIKNVLIECRMALPGAQAVLGFQFAIVFSESFSKVSRVTQWVHFASLVATTLAIVLLIAPAAYHRLAEGGEDTEHFHTVASRLLIAALVFLAPGMAGDLYVVIVKVTNSTATALAIAGGLLIACYLLWFGLSLLKRRPEG